MRKLAAILLLTWGLMNAIGGGLGARERISPRFGLLFLGAGTVIVAGAGGFWLRRCWAVWVTLAGLVGLSLVSLASAHVIRGPDHLRISHHLARLVVSGTLFALALAGMARDKLRSDRGVGSG
jgi:hypothetical protein